MRLKDRLERLEAGAMRKEVEDEDTDAQRRPSPEAIPVVVEILRAAGIAPAGMGASGEPLPAEFVLTCQKLGLLPVGFVDSLASPPVLPPSGPEAQP